MKIPVTKQELLEIANIEFAKQPNYKSHFKIVDVRVLGNLFVFDVPSNNQTDESLILSSQGFATELADKYALIG